MLDGDSFVKAGWILNLRLHQFPSFDKLKFVVMGKVRHNNFERHNYGYIDMYRLSTPSRW